MVQIASSKELRNAIQLLAIEHSAKEKHLKEQLLQTYVSLKPANLLSSTLKDITSSPYLIENIIGTAVGLTTGYFTNRIVVGQSTSLFRKLFGTAVQLGVTKLVTQHSDNIKSIGQSILQHIFRKKRATS